MGIMGVMGIMGEMGELGVVGSPGADCAFSGNYLHESEKSRSFGHNNQPNPKLKP